MLGNILLSLFMLVGVVGGFIFAVELVVRSVRSGIRRAKMLRYQADARASRARQRRVSGDGA